jgi:predicted house-cleaning NTP pyrophosphatase (Maf/HAM1 superfamily)
MRVILGSTSPRRRELLGGLFERLRGDGARRRRGGASRRKAGGLRTRAWPRTSCARSRPRASRPSADDAPRHSCDTIVTRSTGRLSQALRLRRGARHPGERFSGRTHRVISGLSVVLRRAGGRLEFATAWRLRRSPLSPRPGGARGVPGAH